MDDLMLEPLKQKKPPGPGPLVWLKRLLFLAVGLVMFVTAVFFATFKITGSSDFCIKCHEMKPEYLTWQVSSHSQFECIKCHVEPGLSGILEAEVRGARFLLAHLTRPSSMPIKTKEPIKNEVCTKCHSLNRSVTASGDLLIPHERHDRKGVACVQCHSGVAHGNIVERGFREQTHLVDWTSALAKEQMVSKYTNPPMDACLNCHSLKNVTTKCSICHSRVVIPDDHKTAPWIAEGQHGLNAHQGIRECHKCHSYSFKGEYQPFDMVVKDYVQQNEFCVGCHSFNRPPSHKKNQDEWLPVHYNRGYQKGLNNCLTCHDVEKPKEETKYSIKVYCNNCHWFDPL